MYRGYKQSHQTEKIIQLIQSALSHQHKDLVLYWIKQEEKEQSSQLLSKICYLFLILNTFSHLKDFQTLSHTLIKESYKLSEQTLQKVKQTLTTAPSQASFRFLTSQEVHFLFDLTQSTQKHLITYCHLIYQYHPELLPDTLSFLNFIKKPLSEEKTTPQQAFIQIITHMPNPKKKSFPIHSRHP